MCTTHVKLINTPGTRVGSGYHDKMLAIDVEKDGTRKRAGPKKSSCKSQNKYNLEIYSLKQRFQVFYSTIFNHLNQSYLTN